MPSFPIQLKRNGTAAATPSSLLHGEVALNYADGKLFWKDASNVIQSFTFQAYATSSHTHAASDITSGTLDAARIANDSITYAKIQNVSATDRLLGRSSAGSGDVEEITCTAFGRSLIDDADAAAARTTLSVQPTASPAFTGTVLVGISSALNSSDGVQVAAANNPGVIIARTVAPSNTNSIAGINATAYDGSAYVAGGTINFRAAENWSSTNHGTDIQFRATPAGSGGALTEVMRITGGGQTLVTAGSGSSGSYKPGLAISGDDDTGIHQVSGNANTLSIVTNGTERVRVDASGNVGIGTQTTTDLLNVNGLSSFYQSSNGTPSLGSKTYYASKWENASGGYGIGVNVATSGNALVQVQRFDASATSYDLCLQPLGGSVLIGTTSNANATYLLQVNSQIYATNATIATSDARFKTNVESLTDATSVIESLRPVAFDFIPQTDRNFATDRQVGLIAQEAQAALAGTDYADSVVAQCGDHLGLAYEKLVPVLIKALQESNARIAALEERING